MYGLRLKCYVKGILQYLLRKLQNFFEVQGGLILKVTQEVIRTFKIQIFLNS